MADLYGGLLVRAMRGGFSGGASCVHGVVVEDEACEREHESTVPFFSHVRERGIKNKKKASDSRGILKKPKKKIKV